MIWSKEIMPWPGLVCSKLPSPSNHHHTSASTSRQSTHHIAVLSISCRKKCRYFCPHLSIFLHINPIAIDHPQGRSRLRWINASYHCSIQPRTSHYQTMRLPFRKAAGSNCRCNNYYHQKVKMRMRNSASRCHILEGKLHKMTDFGLSQG